MRGAYHELQLCWRGREEGVELGKPEALTNARLLRVRVRVRVRARVRVRVRVRVRGLSCRYGSIDTVGLSYSGQLKAGEAYKALVWQQDDAIFCDFDSLAGDNMCSVTLVGKGLASL